MARWVAMMHVGATSSTGLVAMLGMVAGLCMVVMIIGLCTISRKHNRVQNKDSDIDERTPAFSSKSPKKWMNLSSKKLATTNEPKRTMHDDALAAYERDFAEENGLDSPVWQRTILMGERCEPPVFSGLILYDERGNRVPEFPCKSPRATAAPPSLLHLSVN